MTFSLPPNYVPLLVEIIDRAFEPEKPLLALFGRFVRLLALAWQNKYERTPKLREEDLYNTIDKEGNTVYGYLKVSRREYFQMKREMELLGWLRSTRPAAGFVQFIFSREVLISPKTELSAKTRIEMQKTAPLVGGGDSLEDLILDLDSPTPPQEATASAENRTLPSVVEILAQTPLLFDGDLVHSRDLGDRDPEHALAWCAYAYSIKRKLTGPGGVVRKRLMDHEQPPAWALAQWREVLPVEFLEALSLVEFVCEVCQCVFPKRAELDAHKLIHPQKFGCTWCDEEFDLEQDLEIHIEREHTARGLVVDPSALQPINGGMCAEQAWQSVLGQLSMEMPRSSFETWVRDTKAVRYDGNALYIGVRNAYARDWLESRLASTVSRLLVGILRGSVDVEFVTE